MNNTNKGIHKKRMKDKLENNTSTETREKSVAATRGSVLTNMTTMEKYTQVRLEGRGGKDGD